jgi:hypothetical protein
MTPDPFTSLNEQFHQDSIEQRNDDIRWLLTLQMMQQGRAMSYRPGSGPTAGQLLVCNLLGIGLSALVFLVIWFILP